MSASLPPSATREPRGALQCVHFTHFTGIGSHGPPRAPNLPGVSIFGDEIKNGAVLRSHARVMTKISARICMRVATRKSEFPILRGVKLGCLPK
jgi:hypothetical protein